MARGNFGERLKREREMREVSIEELTKATRISTRFVEALENEDWARLPRGVFGHGVVRTIARYLGLNEESLLGAYDLARSEQAPAPPPKPAERIPSSPHFATPAATAGVITPLIAPQKNPPLFLCPRNLSPNPVRLRLDQRNNPPPLLLLISPSPPPPPRVSASSRTANFFSTPSCLPGRRVTFRPISNSR